MLLPRTVPSIRGFRSAEVNGSQAAASLAAAAAALLVGASAATGHAPMVGGALIALIFGGVALSTYLGDPIKAFIGLWLVIVLISPLSAVVGYQSSTGESVRQLGTVLVCLFVLLTLRRAMLSDSPWPPLRYVAAGAGVAFFGLASSIASGAPSSVTLVGAVLGLKLWILVVTTLMLPWKAADGDRVYPALMSVGVVVAILGLLDYATHGAVSSVFHTNNYNVAAGAYRSDAVHSSFPTPGGFSLFMSLLFAVSFARFTSQARRQDLLLAALFAISILLSLRLKGFLSLAVVIVIVGMVQGATSGRRAVIALLLGTLVLGGGYYFERSVIEKQVDTYTSTENTARSRLYKTGEKIASSNFPLGVGFGRYASYPSQTTYSPVYRQYRLNDVYGLSPDYPAFIDDTSWPSVMGETGYGGLAVYVAGLLALIAALVRRIRRPGHKVAWLPLAALCALAAVLVDSLGNPTLFSWLATATLALIL